MTSPGTCAKLHQLPDLFPQLSAFKMPSFLFCIHHFEAASPRLLHEFMFEQEYGKLYGAVPVELPSLEVADALRTKARWNCFEKFGFAFPEHIHEDEDYFTYHFSPFLKKQKTPFSEWDPHTDRGTEGDFFSEVQDGWEYQDAEIAILLTDEALDQWGCVEVAAARRSYENWKKSVDAQQENPDDHAFYCLRECEEIASYIPMPDAALPATPLTKERKEKAMKHTAEWLFAFARAIEIIVETFKKTGEKIKFTNLARLLETEGWKPEGTDRFDKDLGEQKDIRALHNKIKNRPKTPDSDEYRKWESEFDEQAKFYFERLIQGDREGLDAATCAEEYRVKKKKLMEQKLMEKQLMEK